MAENRFWHLDDPGSATRYAEWVDDEVETEEVVCAINEGDRRGGRRLTDLSVALPGRGQVQDFVWTWYSECLVQDHVLALFRRSGFTGFDVRPVKAKFKRPSEQRLPRLWELIVTGWAGMASAESGIKLVERCEGCGHLRYSGCNDPGRLMEVSQWDGSDFFMVWPLPKYIFVTDRVVQVIRDNRLKGAVFKRLMDLEFSSGGFSPGRLSYSMPEKRARELGEALGID